MKCKRRVTLLHEIDVRRNYSFNVDNIDLKLNILNALINLYIQRNLEYNEINFTCKNVVTFLCN
jgi:hypothetical protein